MLEPATSVTATADDGRPRDDVSRCGEDLARDVVVGPRGQHFTVAGKAPAGAVTRQALPAQLPSNAGAKEGAARLGQPHGVLAHAALVLTPQLRSAAVATRLRGEIPEPEVTVRPTAPNAPFSRTIKLFLW